MSLPQGQREYQREQRVLFSFMKHEKVMTLSDKLAKNASEEDVPSLVVLLVTSLNKP